MAAPITHIVLADNVFDKYFSSKDKSAFIVGTSFPDIRYLKVIEREKTHAQITKLSDVLDSNSFITGLRFHSLVDKVREDYMKKNDIYSLFDSSTYVSQSIKIFEDMVLYERVKNWEQIAQYFEQIYKEEKDFGIKDEDIKRWHNLLQKYLIYPPSDEQTKIFINGLGREGMAEGITHVLSNIKNREKVEEIINNFYTQFEALIL